jgi:hypothetical protein
MTRITRVSILTLPTLVVALIGAAGCSSSNPPAQTGVGGGQAQGTTGGSTSTAAGTTGGAAAGTTGGAAAGTTGGAAAGTTGGAAAGTTGGAATTGTLGDPLCGNTAAGVAIAKNGACVAADTQLCYKTCGPISSGFKTETCTAGAYAEQSGTITCSFPVGPDYSCYKIPTTFDASCPAAATPPQATKPCTTAACVVCGTAYLDSGGAAKVGYCVCNTTAAAPTWSCASTSAWPCPAGAGC